MKLLLRAQDLAWVTVGLAEMGEVSRVARFACRPETILNAVVKSLADWGIPWDDIDSLAVVDGPGSFTALRSALTIANTIAFVRCIPLATCHAKLEETDALVMKRLQKARPDKAMIVPYYGQPPRITVSRQKRPKTFNR